MGGKPPNHTTPTPNVTNSYTSRQDFNVQLARMTKPVSPIIRDLLPRTLANDSDALFTRYLHGAMGYRADQPAF